MSELSGRESRHLRQQHKLAKDLIRGARARDATAIARLRKLFPDRSQFKLADAQLVVARDAGFDSWTALIRHVEQQELAAAQKALHSGDAEGLRRLLAGSEFLRSIVNAPLADFGRRALHFAAKDRAMVEVLMDFGADANQKSDWHNGPYLPLDEATEETARYMISRGARLTANVAARLRWIDELKQLLDENPQQVHALGGDGKTPLHEAKTVPIADLLLSRGATIDQPCIDHASTPAQYAVAERPQVCRHLLQCGARPDVFMAARLGDLELSRRLIDADPGCVAARINLPGYPLVGLMHIYCWTIGWYRSPRLVAREAGHAAVEELFAERSDARTLLLDAVWNEDEAACRAILSRQPDLFSRMPPDDHRMFSHLTHFRKRKSFALLLEIGFDPMHRGHDGGSAFHHACWVGDDGLVQLLLQSGRCNLESRDPNHNSTPLGWAMYGREHCNYSQGSYARTIALLLAAGAKPDA